MPARLNRLVLGVVAAGAACLATSIALAGPRPEWWRLVLVFVAFALGETAMFHIRLGHDRRSFTWAETACIVALAATPAAWALPVAALATAAPHAARRRPAVKVAFNAASVAIGVMAAHLVREWIDGPHGSMDLESFRAWIALSAGAVAYFAITTALVSAAVAWSQNAAFLPIHLKDLPLNALVAAGNIAVGIVVVSEAARDPLLLVPLPLLAALLVVVYRSYLRLVEDRDMWESLHAASRDLLEVDAEDLTGSILEWAAKLFAAETVDLVAVEGRTATVWSWHQARGFSAPRIGDPFALVGTFWGRALSDREPFQVDASTAPATQREELAKAGLASCVVAPLLIQDECVGTLRIGFRGRTCLRRRELRVFSTFANNVSAALHNARLFDEIHDLAMRDPLTGLPNRNDLIRVLDAALDEARRGDGGLAVLFLDVDRFKVVNDSLGHDAGDALLVAVAERLRTALGDGELVGRFGSDEFVVVCTQLANDDDAIARARRLAATTAGPVTVRGSELYLSLSIGVAIAGRDAVDAASLIRDADTAMYEAKALGRARVHLFDATARLRAVARLQTESDLRRAIGRRELDLVYQPILEPATQRIVGVEALVRWQHPTRGVVSPLDFIPLAEETGLIGAVGERVLDEACRQIDQWRRRGVTGDEFRVGVNLSAHQLADAGLVDRILDALARHAVDAANLCVEITESALLVDTDVVADNLQRLRDVGVELAIDDFGTGYSSVSYLHRLPVGVLKIDRSFIARLGTSARENALVAGLVDLGHALGMEVVAEGVETAAQLSAVQHLGCDRVQGFYVSKPLPPAELEELLAMVTAF